MCYISSPYFSDGVSIDILMNMLFHFYHKLKFGEAFTLKKNKDFTDFHSKRKYQIPKGAFEKENYYG